jgi:hypothetical protein
MKVAIAILALFSLTVHYIGAKDGLTYVNNQWQWTMVVSISYTYDGTPCFWNGK